MSVLQLRLFAGAVLATFLVASQLVLAPPSLNLAEMVRVIVQAPGAEAAAAAAVRAEGGTVTAPLPIVSGFAATLPIEAVSRLSRVPGVRAVTEDDKLFPDSTTTPVSNKLPAPPKSVYRIEIGADSLFAQGKTGAGVRVALVDTGVDTEVAATGDLAGRIVPIDNPYQVPTLEAPDPVNVPCANFSGELTCDDTFGHGTFMAGLIAGNGAASAGRYLGTAPGADIISVKVGGADGSADVSKVLAGIQWVVSFKDVYNIRVMNLSLGSDSTVPPDVDPLNLAVQRAWVSGVTVIVSAGNFGRPAPGVPYGTITKPGDDPFVITVGSVDDEETTKIKDDRLPAFSSWGPTFHGLQKPDIVAPGARVVSLRALGSKIDAFAGIVDGTYRRGSGTSMSTAVVSGLAAQLLQARPQWRPDDVKDALLASAENVASKDPRAVGRGLVNGPAALNAKINPTYRTSVTSTGVGGLLASAGTNLVTCLDVTNEACAILDGGTGQGNSWHGALYAAQQWTPTSWYESQWVVGVAGNSWHGNSWHATTWATGNSWHGNSWHGSSYYGKPDTRTYGTTTSGSGSYGAWG